MCEIKHEIRRAIGSVTRRRPSAVAGGPPTRAESAHGVDKFGAGGSGFWLGAVVVLGRVGVSPGDWGPFSLCFGGIFSPPGVFFVRRFRGPKGLWGGTFCSKIGATLSGGVGLGGGNFVRGGIRGARGGAVGGREKGWRHPGKGGVAPRRSFSNFLLVFRGPGGAGKKKKTKTKLGVFARAKKAKSAQRGPLVFFAGERIGRGRDPCRKVGVRLFRGGGRRAYFISPAGIQIHGARQLFSWKPKRSKGSGAEKGESGRFASPSVKKGPGRQNPRQKKQRLRGLGGIVFRSSVRAGKKFGAFFFLFTAVIVWGCRFCFFF